MKPFIEQHIDEVCRRINSFAHKSKDMLDMGVDHGCISVEHNSLNVYHPRSYHPDATNIEASCNAREFTDCTIAHLNVVIANIWFNITIRVPKGDDLYCEVEDFIDRCKVFTRFYLDDNET